MNKQTDRHTNICTKLTKDNKQAIRKRNPIESITK